MTEIEEKSRVYTAGGNFGSIGVPSNICPSFLSTVTVNPAAVAARVDVYNHNTFNSNLVGARPW